MNRQQKIAFLQEVAKGNRQPLQELITAGSEDPMLEDIVLCFHYLLEHGRPGEYPAAAGIKFPVSAPQDLAEVESVLSTYSRTGAFEGATREALDKLQDCMECYDILRQAKKLHLLNPYRHLLNNSFHE